jgi:hypothetical protein
MPIFREVGEKDSDAPEEDSPDEAVIRIVVVSMEQCCRVYVIGERNVRWVDVLEIVRIKTIGEQPIESPVAEHSNELSKGV